MNAAAARRALVCLLAVSWGCGSEAPVARAPGVAQPREPDVSPAAEPVVGWTGPGDLPFAVTLRAAGGVSAVHRTIGTRTFEIALRPLPLAQQPCTSCHVGPRVSAARTEDAHQDIQPVHPSEAPDVCVGCHAPRDVSRLQLQSGETVPLDDSYRVCAQCHSSQVEAWAGGAHGKRLGGWQGERVVLGCGYCHDPHRPEIPRRVPFRGPVLP